MFLYSIAFSIGEEVAICIHKYTPEPGIAFNECTEHRKARSSERKAVIE